MLSRFPEKSKPTGFLAVFTPPTVASYRNGKRSSKVASYRAVSGGWEYVETCQHHFVKSFEKGNLPVMYHVG